MCLIFLSFLQGFDIPRVLQLPLADDVYMAHTLQIAMRYYKNVMVES